MMTLYHLNIFKQFSVKMHRFTYYVCKMMRFHRFFFLRKYSNGKRKLSKSVDVKVVPIRLCFRFSVRVPSCRPRWTRDSLTIFFKMIFMIFFFSQLDYRTKFTPATTTMEFSRRNGNKGGSELLSHPHSSKNWRGRFRRHIIQTSTRVKRLP